MPFQRMYIVNSPELIPAIQKQWRHVSFAALTAGAGAAVGLSKKGVELLNEGLTSEQGFHTWAKFIMSSMGPSKDLDSLNRNSIEIFAQDMDKLRAEGAPIRTGLWGWSREIMLKSTTEAVWGPQNPYRDAAVAKAWK